MIAASFYWIIPWSDGRLPPGVPGGEDLAGKCPSCHYMYWLSDHNVNTAHLDKLELEDLQLNLLPELPDFISLFKNSKSFHGDKRELFLTSEREKHLRIKYMHYFNDETRNKYFEKDAILEEMERFGWLYRLKRLKKYLKYRKEIKYFDSYHFNRNSRNLCKNPDIKKNLEVLLGLLGETPQERLIKAEILRRMSRFPEALAILRKNFPQEYRREAATQTTLCARKDTKLHIIGKENREARKVTNFFFAVELGSVPDLARLIKKGVDVNTTDIQGDSALHKAIFRGKISVIKFLISAGAQVNIKNAMGYTPLHVAMVYLDLNIIKLLISKGANLYQKNNYSNTPLHTAAMRHAYANHEEYISLFKYLASRNVDFNIPGNYNMTALHILLMEPLRQDDKGKILLWDHSKTLENKLLDLVRFLVIRGGADPTAPDMAGYSPYQYALQNRMDKVAAYLATERAA